MSYSDFKEQKCFNFRPFVSAAFPLKRRTTCQNSLSESTAFCKKVFIKNIHLNSTAALWRAALFEARGIVGNLIIPATLKFNFF